MIQAKLYQIPCFETGKFALHAEQITAGPDERQLGNSSCGLELGLSLTELARGGQGIHRDRQVPSKPMLPCLLILEGLQGCASSGLVLMHTGWWAEQQRTLAPRSSGPESNSSLATL